MIDIELKVTKEDIRVWKEMARIIIGETDTANKALIQQSKDLTKKLLEEKGNCTTTSSSPKR